MTDHITRQRVTEFLDGYYAGDAERVVACCAEDFDSIVYAPIELFPDLGQKRGRRWAIDAILAQQNRYASRRHELTFVTIDGETASTMARVTLKKRTDGRVVQLEVADFFKLRDGLIVSHRSFFDSFDLVQQVLGQDLAETFAKDVKRAMFV